MANLKTPADFPKNTKVRFRAGPFATSDTEAVVTGSEKGWLVTKDADGKQRKTRPGACTKI